MSVIQADYIVPYLNSDDTRTTSCIKVAGCLTDTASLSFSGCATATASASINVINGLCHVSFSASATETATSPFVSSTSGDLATYAPLTAVTLPCYVSDNGTAGAGLVTINTAGAISIQSQAVNTVGTWAASGTGIFALNASYPIA